MHRSHRRSSHAAGNAAQRPTSTPLKVSPTTLSKVPGMRRLGFVVVWRLASDHRSPLASSAQARGFAQHRQDNRPMQMADSKLVASQGFEPQYAESESAVLPLNDEAMRGNPLEADCIQGEHGRLTSAANLLIIRGTARLGQFHGRPLPLGREAGIARLSQHRDTSDRRQSSQKANFHV